MSRHLARIGLFLCVLVRAWALPAVEPVRPGEEVLVSAGTQGIYGGRLTIGQRSEPKTLNPILASDAVSREVIHRIMADLVHINRATQRTEPALAKTWKLSPDGRTFTLQLRRGIRFSDGQPFDADDVVFSYQLYLDEQLHSPQRDLLVIDGKAMTVTKVDAYTVRFTLTKPYGAAERIFDGLAIVPRHILEKPYREGRLAQMWGLAAQDVVGLGPFRVKQYVAGQKIVLERNPYYWKTDAKKQRLPYLDEMTFLFVGSEDNQLIRFQAGETDMISRLGAENYALLAKSAQSRGFQLADLGPSLEYNFLVFNLNDVAAGKPDLVSSRQAWFREPAFRKAVSAAIDREGIARLVYGGYGTPLWGNVSPGNKLWVNSTLSHPARSLDAARAALRSAGFHWAPEGTLLDRAGRPVEFSILTSSSNAQRSKIATLLQDDLKQIGMRVNVVSMDFRSMLDRLLQTYDYDAAIMGLGGGDADPNPEVNVWSTSGTMHLWHLGQASAAQDWERELDGLMQQQMITIDYRQRKKLYDRAQLLIAENLPFIFLATPNVLTAAKAQLGNFHPAILDHYTLWNVEELFWRDAAQRGR
jgi:peptide/nickel transport system substrate-binding protein